MTEPSGLRLSIAGVLVFCIVSAASGEVPLPTDARVLDPDLLMCNEPAPTISPNGDWVAYISQGFVCAVNIESGQPRRLLEVPDTWSHFLALPEHSEADGDFGNLIRGMSRDEYNATLKKIKNRITGLQWTAESDAVVFGVISHDASTSTTQSDVFLAPLQGEPKRIAHSRTPISGRGIGWDFILTKDRQFLVTVSQWKRPLIWDVENNRPRATCFLNMTPSPTSDHWIAVEKDTRQLVITDHDFSVVQRFDEILPPNKYGFKMHWSPDERYVICRTQIGFDHYSNWEGFRLDLQTNQRRALSGSYMKEEVVFTGTGGEFLRIGCVGKQGNVSGLFRVESYFQIVPTGPGEPEYLWQLHADPDNPLISRLGKEPPVTFSPDFSLFTIGLPRQTGPYGIVYHLLNRNHRLWKLSPEDSGEYHSPYNVVGFVKQGTMIVGYDQHRLFAVPVSAIRK